MTPAGAPLAELPPSPWALRFSIRLRNGNMGGTVTIPLGRLPRGRSPLEEAHRLLAIQCPGATAILPRRVLIGDALEAEPEREEVTL